MKVGDLVRWRNVELPEDWDAVGLILEMRSMAFRQPDARILWSDMSETRWYFISDLVPVPPIDAGVE